MSETLEDRGLRELRRGVRELCARFPDGYWRDLDARREYPEEFVRAMTEAGYLAALVPEGYGGTGLDLTAARAAANVAARTFGDYGVDAEYDAGRKFGETRLYRAAPIPALSHRAQHVPGPPRSF